MRIKQVKAKSIVTRSNIPDIDFVINPYVGCQHGCIYCYAEFMKRFTHHSGERWGDFLDIKQIDYKQIDPQKYNGKTLLLSSVTDPYLPLEKKCRNTRKILEHLIGMESQIIILTKSKLVTRDIDLFKKFPNIHVGVSLNTLNDDFARLIEPAASSPSDRLAALETIYQKGITTYVFVSPIFPKITDYQKIIEKSKAYSNYFEFENLNFRAHNIQRIFTIIQQNYPNLVSYYKQIQRNPSLWTPLEESIKQYCTRFRLSCKIEFHHGGFSGKKD